MATKKTKAPPAFDCLAVTDVKLVYPLSDFRKRCTMKAIADVTLNDQLILRGLRVMDGVTGLFVGYPADPFCRDDDYKVMYNPSLGSSRSTSRTACLRSTTPARARSNIQLRHHYLYSGVVSGTTLDIHNQQGVIQ